MALRCYAAFAVRGVEPGVASADYSGRAMDKKLIPNPNIPLDLPTGERIQAAVDHYGVDTVLRNALRLLRGNDAGKDFLLYAGGRHALGILDGAPRLYWPELWGARVFTHIWDDAAAPAVIAGLTNQAWRVREMCARVILVNSVPAADQLVALTTDDNARVRIAALRALGAQGTAEHLDTFKPRLSDRDKSVRPIAQQSRDAIRARLAAAANADVQTSGAE